MTPPCPHASIGEVLSGDLVCRDCRARFVLVEVAVLDELTEPAPINLKAQTVLNAMKANPNTRTGVWLDELQAALSQDTERVWSTALAAMGTGA